MAPWYFASIVTFKLKQYPGSSPFKYKAFYCVRRYLQAAGVDYFETYDLIVKWLDLCLALTMIIYNNWQAKKLY